MSTDTGSRSHPVREARHLAAGVITALLTIVSILVPSKGGYVLDAATSACVAAIAAWLLTSLYYKGEKR